MSIQTKFNIYCTLSIEQNENNFYNEKILHYILKNQKLYIFMVMEL